MVDSAIATALHAIHATVHSTLGITRGALIFHRDMLHDIPLQQKRQVLIDENLRRQNKNRRQFKYRVNDEVLLIEPTPNKLDPRAYGPFRIINTWTNDTVTIQKTPHLQETINI